MDLTGHFIVWFAAVAVVVMASPLVRAYVAHAERRSRARADDVVARLLSQRRTG